jgi:tyrosyl-tRNA synthetase
MTGKEVYGMTFSLLTNSEGKKMGKTAKGALWLSADRCSPFEFFQYWRNVDDADVNKCLRMLTFLPMEEVNRLSALEGSELNKDKEVLAYEVTKLVHGEEEAKKALEAARAAFGGGAQDTSNIPAVEMNADDFDGEGVGLVNLIRELGLVPSNGEGFRTIKQGGLTVADEKVNDTHRMITEADFKDGELVIRKGKKKFVKIVLK